MYDKTGIKVYSSNKHNDKRKNIKSITIKWNIKLYKYIKSRTNIE